MAHFLPKSEKENMCHVCPPLWAFFRTQRNISLLQSELGPSDSATFFILSLLSVVPSVWYMLGLFSVSGIYVET